LDHDLPIYNNIKYLNDKKSSLGSHVVPCFGSHLDCNGLSAYPSTADLIAVSKKCFVAKSLAAVSFITIDCISLSVWNMQNIQTAIGLFRLLVIGLKALFCRRDEG
jgi:hypothetical protein